MKNKVKALLVLCCLLVVLVGVVPVSAKNKVETWLLQIGVGDSVKLYEKTDIDYVILSKQDSMLTLKQPLTSKLEFNIGNKKVVSVENGTLVAKKKGTTFVTLKADDVVVAKWKVKVKKANTPKLAVAKDLPKLESNKDYEVLGSYSYIDGEDATHFIYIVQAKKSVVATVKMDIYQKNVNLYGVKYKKYSLGSVKDTAYLTKGAVDYFDLAICMGDVSLSNTKKFGCDITQTSKQDNNYKPACEGRLEVRKQYKEDDFLHLVIETVNSFEDSTYNSDRASIKFLLFKGKKVVYSSQDTLTNYWLDNREGSYDLYSATRLGGMASLCFYINVDYDKILICTEDY